MEFTALQLTQLGLLASSYGISIVASMQQVGHLRALPQIATADDLARFRDFARGQMYLTVAFMAFALPAIILVFVDRSPASLAQRFILWLPYGGMFLFGYLGKRREARIQDPARCAEPLRPDFLRLCAAWKKKLLPDF
jgi:hypothetical protein